MRKIVPKKKYRIVKASFKDYLIVIIMSINVILFVSTLGMLYKNIILEKKTNNLKSYLIEYQVLQQEIDILKEIKENYEIVIKSNEELQSKKKELENKITQLKIKISNIDKKIDKFK